TPGAANSSTVARPTPAEAPVITTVLGAPAPFNGWAFISRNRKPGWSSASQCGHPGGCVARRLAPRIRSGWRNRFPGVLALDHADHRSADAGFGAPPPAADTARPARGR